MPNRLLREGICSSDQINDLLPEEEVMFYRLLVVADDYGYMDARPAILKAQCFPLRDTATPPKIELWLSGLADKKLITRYQKDGKPYLSINKWEQRVRSRPKYASPDDDGCQTLDGQLSVNCPSYDGLGKGKGKGKGAAELRPLPEGWNPKPETVENLSAEFGLRVPHDTDKYVSAFRDACASKGYRYKDFDAAFRNCVRQDWPKLRQGGAVQGQKKVSL
jgi:hypothetical protein